MAALDDLAFLSDLYLSIAAILHQSPARESLAGITVFEKHSQLGGQGRPRSQGKLKKRRDR